MRLKLLTNRIVSFILIFTLVLSMGTQALASYTAEPVEGASGVSADYSEAEVIQAIRDIVDELSPEGKQIFISAISADRELSEFYRDNIEVSFVPQIAVATRVYDPVKDLERSLKALALPTAVVVALVAVGSGFVAAAADGPLIFGDAYAAVVTVGAAVVIAANWAVVGPKWNQIVKIFQRVFAESAKVVIQTFNKLKEQVLEKVVATTPKVTVNGKTITIDGKTYQCRVRADTLTDQQKRGTYYPAVRFGNLIFVDLAHTLSAKEAKLLLGCNNAYAGVLSMTSSLAKSIAAPVVREDTAHRPGQPGYFPHFHPQNAPRAHSWYIV